MSSSLLSFCTSWIFDKGLSTDDWGIWRPVRTFDAELNENCLLHWFDTDLKTDLENVDNIFENWWKFEFSVKIYYSGPLRVVHYRPPIFSQIFTEQPARNKDVKQIFDP